MKTISDQLYMNLGEATIWQTDIAVVDRSGPLVVTTFIDAVMSGNEVIYWGTIEQMLESLKCKLEWREQASD